MAETQEEDYLRKFAVPIDKNELNETIFSIPILEKNRVIKMEIHEFVQLNSKSKVAVLEDVIIKPEQKIDVVGATGNEISCDKNSKFVFDDDNIFAEMNEDDEIDEFYTPPNSHDDWSQEIDIPPTQVLMKNQFKLVKIVDFGSDTATTKLVNVPTNSQVVLDTIDEDENEEFYTPPNSHDVWSQDIDIPPTQVLMKNQLKLVGNQNSVPSMQPIPTPSESSVKSTRIDWIETGVTYNISPEIHNAIVDNGTLVHTNFLYRKDSIGIELDLLFKGCVIYVDKHYEGENSRRLSAYCAHKGCRKYSLVCDYENQLQYKVLYDKIETLHIKPITRRLRRYERDQSKVELKTTFPTTYREQQIRNADEEIITLGNYQRIKSDTVFRKARSEIIQSNDNDTDDILDIEAMITDDQDTNFISKMLSRKKFAVYIHSKIQHQVLHKLHLKRRKDGTEVTGRLDASGNIARDIDGVEGPILYYALIVNLKIANDKSTTPLALTEQFNCKHFSKDISEWLFNFKESHYELYDNPPTLFDWIVTDFSYANFHAVSHAFNNIAFSDYLNIAFEWIRNKIDDGEFATRYYELVKLRMCYTHLMHTFADMLKKYFGKTKKGKQTPEGRIILEILASMIQSNDFEKIMNLWEQLCILMKNEYVNDDVENVVANVLAITSSDLDEFESQTDQNIVDIDALPEKEKVLYKNNLFYIQFSKILEDTETYFYNEAEKNKNPYFKPEFLDKFLKRFIPLLPLWSYVLMTTTVNDHHNQFIENYFGLIKTTLVQQSATLGAIPTKMGRVITLSRKKTESTVKSFNLDIPKAGLNSQVERKKPEKKKTADDKPKTNAKTDTLKKQSECCGSDSTAPLFDDSTSDASSFVNAKEQFNKSKPRGPFTYFQQRGMKKITKNLQSDENLQSDVVEKLAKSDVAGKTSKSDLTAKTSQSNVIQTSDVQTLESTRKETGKPKRTIKVPSRYRD